MKPNNLLPDRNSYLLLYGLIQSFIGNFLDIIKKSTYLINREQSFRIGMFKSSIYAVFIGILLISCKQGDYRKGLKENGIIEIAIPKKASKIFDLDSILGKVEITKLEIPIEHYIDFVNPYNFIPFEDGYIAGDLYGARRIVKFNHDGSFQTQILEEGEGPEMYSNVISILEGHDKRFLIQQSFPPGFVQTDSKFQMLERISVLDDLRNGIYSPKHNQYVFYGGFHFHPDGNNKIHLYDTEFNKSGQQLQEPEGFHKLKFISLRTNFSLTPEKDVLFFESYQDTVFQLNDDGSFMPKYRIKYPNKQTYDEIIQLGLEESEREYDPFRKSKVSEYFHLHRGFFECDRYIFFNISKENITYYVIVDKMDYQNVIYTTLAVSKSGKFILPPAWTYDSNKQKLISNMSGQNIKGFFEKDSPVLEGLEIEDEESYMVSYSFKK
ncbi:6-bladed beta-propeller [Belliella marina]|uniref:6-bladed beta-propeller n=1 Tax=Belliella marina TaxID=1644146 RepID=A0ABW4VKT3_9BACT